MRANKDCLSDSFSTVRNGRVCIPVKKEYKFRINGSVIDNHKRRKLHVAASELYPEDYDFSIVFDTVENRKARHQMERKYTEGIMVREEEES